MSEAGGAPRSEIEPQAYAFISCSPCHDVVILRPSWTVVGFASDSSAAAAAVTNATITTTTMSWPLNPPANREPRSSSASSGVPHGSPEQRDETEDV